MSSPGATTSSAAKSAHPPKNGLPRLGRHDPASPRGAVVAIRIPLGQRAASHNPGRGVKRPKANNGEGKTPALGDHQARDLLVAPGKDTVAGEETINKCAAPQQEAALAKSPTASSVARRR
jgi:hypothetical protein